jgi:hypothetical protein
MANRACSMAFLALSTAAPAAGANPIATETLQARQIPHSKHVQLTYANLSEITAAAPLSRDGAALSPVWSPLSSYTFNAGSGLTSYGAVQYCDCNVAIGPHRYATQLSYTYDGKTDEYELNATVTVVEALDDPKDAGPVPSDAMPWEIPDPVEVQGLDCIATCAHPPAPDAGAGTRTGSGTSAGAPAHSTQIGDNDGGCSLAGRRAGAGTLMLGLGLLIGLGRRRRAVRG